MLWGSLALGSSRVISCCLRHACVLLGILFIFEYEWLNSLVRKDKVFSFVNEGGVVFMLCLLLWYSTKRRFAFGNRLFCGNLSRWL